GAWPLPYSYLGTSRFSLPRTVWELRVMVGMKRPSRMMPVDSVLATTPGPDPFMVTRYVPSARSTSTVTLPVRVYVSRLKRTPTFRSYVLTVRSTALPSACRGSTRLKKGRARKPRRVNRGPIEELWYPRSRCRDIGSRPHQVDLAWIACLKAETLPQGLP